MHGLLMIAQYDANTPDDWWWMTLTSRPALVMLSIALVSLVLIVFMLVRMGRVAAPRRAQVSLKQRLANDSGVAMAEFALVSPFLMFISLIMLQAMLVFTGLFYVQYAAYAGARSAIVQIPSEAMEPSNYLMPVQGSEKFDAIQSSVFIGLMPVSGREAGSSIRGQEIATGLTEVYQYRGEDVPPWVGQLIAQRYSYAENHTEVVVESVRPSGGDTIEFEEASGLTEFSPKEAIAVRVRHEFALTIPVASEVFTIVGPSGTYQPVSISSDSPGPPGHWTLIEARAILTNEGIDRFMPDPPPYPRYQYRSRDRDWWGNRRRGWGWGEEGSP